MKTEPRTPAFPAIGDTVADRFLLTRQAGAGGMGVVFAAQDLVSREQVAVKVLATKFTEDTASAVQRFMREAELLAELRHPRIVRYIGHGLTDSEIPFLAMEWLDGEDLAQRLARQPLTTADSVALCRRLAEGLRVAHERGIIHRDIKPANIFLRNGKIEDVVLMDFGIARRGRQLRGLTQTGFLIGTPDYMAPEQARSQRDIGPAADVFAIGCLLYECLAGRPPFCAEQIAAVVAKILFDAAPKLTATRPHISPQLSDLVDRMLAKEPEQRPQNAGELHDALLVVEELLMQQGTPLAATQPAGVPSPIALEQEQQLVCVIVGVADFHISTAATQEHQATLLLPDHLIGELRQLLSSYDAHVETLGEGMFVVVLTARSDMVATDQVAQAARCALLLRSHVHHSFRLSLATGRGQLAGQRPLGDALDRALALLGSTSPGQALAGNDPVSSAESGQPLLLDETSAGLLDSRFQLRRITTSVYELDSESLSADIKRPLLGKPTPCVGRERELAILEALWNSVREEEGSCLALVTGSPGVGKSRIRHEFIRRIAARGEPYQVWSGRGELMSAGASYSILAQALRQMAGVSDEQPPQLQFEQLRQRLGQRLPNGDLNRVTQFVAEICGIPVAAPIEVLQAARQDARLLGEHVCSALVALIRAECAEAPLLLVLDDLHWGDTLTVRLIDSVLAKVGDCPLMVLALARPEVDTIFPRLWADRRRQDLRLELLSRKACERLIRQVLGGQLSSDACNRLINQAGGNALFLEELIRAAAEGKTDELPSTVLAMLQSRVQSLETGPRRTLRAASVYGERFSYSGVAALLAASESHSLLERGLSALLDQEIIEEQNQRGQAGDRQFSFHHNLIREAAYSLLSDEQKQLLHSHAGDYLERAGEPSALVIAEHFVRSGQSSRAGIYFLRASEQAHRGGDSDAVKRLAARGLQCQPDKPTYIGLLALVSQSHLWKSEWAAAATYGEQVLALAAPGSPAFGVAAAAILCDTWPHRKARFLDVFDAVVRAEPSPGAIATHAFAMAIGIWVLDLAGEALLSQHYLLQLHKLVEPVLESDPLARAWMQRAHVHREAWIHCNPWRGREYSYVARSSFLAALHQRSAVAMEAFVGINSFYLGDLVLAEQELLGTFAYRESLGLLSSLRSYYYIVVLLGLGRISDAQKEAAILLQISEEPSTRSVKGRAYFALAEIALHCGDSQTAKLQIERAIDFLDEAPMERCAAEFVRAASELSLGNTKQARMIAEQAMSESETRGWQVCCGMRSYVTLAMAQQACGDHEAARKTAAAAQAVIARVASGIPDSQARTRYLTEPAIHQQIEVLACT